MHIVYLPTKLKISYIPLTSVQLEFSVTYTAHNDCQDTSYATTSMMSCDEQLIVAFLPKIGVKSCQERNTPMTVSVHTYTQCVSNPSPLLYLWCNYL